MNIIDHHGPLYSCPKCRVVLDHAAAKCPVCEPSQPYVFPAYHPFTIGISGSCEFCACTSPLHTINGKRYCKACFDQRFTLIEKTPTT